MFGINQEYVSFLRKFDYSWYINIAETLQQINIASTFDFPQKDEICQPGALDSLPAGKQVVENPKTGLPMLKGS